MIHPIRRVRYGKLVKRGNVQDEHSILKVLIEGKSWTLDMKVVNHFVEFDGPAREAYKHSMPELASGKDILEGILETISNYQNRDLDLSELPFQFEQREKNGEITIRMKGKRLKREPDDDPTGSIMNLVRGGPKYDYSIVLRQATS